MVPCRVVQAGREIRSKSHSERGLVPFHDRLAFGRGNPRAWPIFFPDGFKPLANEVANREGPATLVSYSSLLNEKGYPSRAVKTYKDKEADWVKKDKDLLSSYRKGRDQYVVTCGACHQADGKGLANMAPALAKSDWVLGDTHRVIGVAVHGLMGPIKVNGEPVVEVRPSCPRMVL